MEEHIAAGRARHPHRRILPAASSPTASGTQHAITRPTSRPKQVTVACDSCRKYKAKCSGDRPCCRRCAQRHIICHYVTEPGETTPQALKRNYDKLRDQARSNAEIVKLLKNLPEQEAMDVLQRIRSGTDVTTILNQVQAGNVLLQMAVSPETRFRYEFPYRSEMPGDYSLDNPYLKSMIYEATSLYTATEPTPFNSWTKLSLESQSLYLKPFHAAQVMDPLLSDVKPSLWTTVCDDDMLMRDLLGTFLRCEYHFAAAFQKDYFLEDMAAQHDEFCSSLLVNIILAYSCVCNPRFANRVEYWNPNTLLYRFLAEAKRLWELEAMEPRITTVQAGILFSVFHNLCGLDEIGQAYRIHGVALAHKLRLFENDFNLTDERSRKGRAFAAWTLFNWETLVAFSFMIPPLIKTPPAWPLPDPAEDAQWYGEVWVKYPLNQRLSPSHFGHVFRARSIFRITMNEFCEAAHSPNSSVTLDKANQLYRDLKIWYENLSGLLLPTTIVLPGHMQLHIYYQHLILSIYEPLIEAETGQQAMVQKIVADAKKYLQTLVRLYYLRHGFEAMDLFIVIPLMLTASDCVEAINNQTPDAELETLRSTLILMAKGLFAQRRNHYLADALFHVIRGQMRPSEVSLLRATMNVDEEAFQGKKELVQAVRSHWPVSVVKKKEEMNSHILKNLVENYGHLNLEETPPAEQESSTKGKQDS